MASPLTSVKYHSTLASGADNGSGKIYTYAAGTTTLQATYTASDGVTPNANPVILDGTGRASIYLNPSLSYKFVCQDSLGASVPDGTVDNWADPGDSLRVDLADKTDVAKGDLLLGVKRTGGSATTQHAENEVKWWDITADSGCVGDGATNNNTAFQAALTNAAVAGVAIHVPKGASYYQLTAGVTAPAGTTIILEDGAELRWTTLGASANAITGSNNLTIRGRGKLTGPSSAAYVLNERGISVIGASTSSRNTNVTIEGGVEISKFGSYGVYGQFTDRIRVIGCYIHDCGFAGATFLSCDNGQFVDNTVDNITPGTGANMYGISLTHDSVGYVGGGKTATNPFCRGWTVSGNEVSRIAWEGIDTHGVYEVDIFHNRVYATRQGISASSSSGAALNYAGYQNAVCFNVVDARNKDGTASGYENIAYGINLNGGSTVKQQDTLCYGNRIYYKGAISNASSGAIQATYNDNIVIANNIIENWGGCGVYTAFINGVISDNLIGDAASAVDTVRYCISDDSSTGRLSVVGNKHLPLAGRTAAAGYSQTATATYRAWLDGNDFMQATTTVRTPTATNFFSGPQNTPYVLESAGSATPTVAALVGAHGVLQLSNTGTYSITNLTGGIEGQVVTLENTSTGTITFTRANARLDGGTSKVLVQYCTLTLKLTGAEWRQVAFANNS